MGNHEDEDDYMEYFGLKELEWTHIFGNTFPIIL
jgi:hypothetical protein